MWPFNFFSNQEKELIKRILREVASTTENLPKRNNFNVVMDNINSRMHEEKLRVAFGSIENEYPVLVLWHTEQVIGGHTVDVFYRSPKSRGRYFTILIHIK